MHRAVYRRNKRIVIRLYNIESAKSRDLPRCFADFCFIYFQMQAFQRRYLEICIHLIRYRLPETGSLELRPAATGRISSATLFRPHRSFNYCNPRSDGSRSFYAGAGDYYIIDIVISGLKFRGVHIPYVSIIVDEEFH